MIAKYYNHNHYINIDDIPDFYICKSGLSIEDLEKTAKYFGFKSFLSEIDDEYTCNIIPLPAIFFRNNNHFIVVYKMTDKNVWVADPAFGKIKYKRKEFVKNWYGELNKGIVLLLEPNSDFEKKIFHGQKNNNFKKTIHSFISDNSAHNS